MSVITAISLDISSNRHGVDPWSVDGTSYHYITRKASKNKWNSQRVAKRCRNKQSKSNKDCRHRRKRYYHNVGDNTHVTISASDKNRKHKSRLTNDNEINKYLNDISDEYQNNIENKWNNNESNINKSTLMVLENKNKRRRRKKRKHRKFASLFDDSSEDGTLSSDYTNSDSSKTVEPEPPKIEVNTEIKINENGDFDINDEIYRLQIESAILDDIDDSKRQELYIQSIQNIPEYNHFAAQPDLVESGHHYKSNANNDESNKMNPKDFKRVMKEIKIDLCKNVTVSYNGSMFIRFDEDNPRFLKALLTGLEDTPYENGLFMFDIYLSSSYPNSPCSITHVTKGATLCTANNGPGGFSPNLHKHTGKVCLSLLGTWGQNQWDPKTSNVYQVLSSILFMIFGANYPYYMEPGHGGWEGTAKMNEMDKTKHTKRVIEYNEEIYYHTILYAMIKTLKEPYIGFEDVIRVHFKLKKYKILNKILNKWIKEGSENLQKKIKPLYIQLKEELDKL